MSAVPLSGQGGDRTDATAPQEEDNPFLHQVWICLSLFGPIKFGEPGIRPAPHLEDSCLTIGPSSSE